VRTAADSRRYTTVLPRRLRPRAATERDHRRATRAPDDGSRSTPRVGVRVAERAHEAHHRMGGHDRDPHDDCRHLWDELLVHAGAALAIRLLRVAGGNGGRMPRVVLGVPPLRLA